jgi:hypothetical protein
MENYLAGRRSIASPHTERQAATKGGKPQPYSDESEEKSATKYHLPTPLHVVNATTLSLSDVFSRRIFHVPPVTGLSKKIERNH